MLHDPTAINFFKLPSLSLLPSPQDAYFKFSVSLLRSGRSLSFLPITLFLIRSAGREETKPSSVSGNKRALEKLGKEIRRIATTADLTIARFFHTTVKKRVAVLEAINEQIATMLRLVDGLPSLLQGRNTINLV